jgi:hypothetical protein
MSDELQVKEKQEIAASNAMDAWGEQAVTSNDIVIEKILFQQFMSEKVKNKEAEYGELRGTLNNEKYGDLNTPMDFVPISVNKFWIEYDRIVAKNGTVKLDYREIVPIQDNPLQEGYNDNLPRVSADGMTERDRVLEFYVLLPEEVENDCALPYILSFKRTGLRAGKKLMTQMYVKNRAANKVPPATACSLSGVDKENDNGQFIVADVKAARPSTDKEIAEAFKWYKIINQGGVKVDNSDLGPSTHDEEVPF